MEYYHLSTAGTVIQGDMKRMYATRVLHFNGPRGTRILGTVDHEGMAEETVAKNRMAKAKGILKTQKVKEKQQNSKDEHDIARKLDYCR